MENRLECGLQTLINSLERLNASLQQLAIGGFLDLQKIGYLIGCRPGAETLTNPLFLGKGISHEDLVALGREQPSGNPINHFT